MIFGKKIRLRLVQEKDLEKLFPLLQEAAYNFAGFLNKLAPIHKLLENFQKNGFWQETEGMMLITDRKENILGTILFKKCNLYQALDLKYIIFDKEDRNQGFMKEALTLFSSYIFSIKEVQRLQLTIPNYHRASISVAQKCGYQFEGIARGSCFHKGKYIDLCIYSLLREECKDVENLLDNKE